jgi:hypothetical protein
VIAVLNMYVYIHYSVLFDRLNSSPSYKVLAMMHGILAPVTLVFLGAIDLTSSVLMASNINTNTIGQGGAVVYSKKEKRSR